jgi:hypothetical protein
MSKSTRSIFSGVNVSASSPFFYNSSKETDIDAGWISAKANDIVIQVGCATAVNTLTYRIEGRAANADRAASIHSDTISGTSSIDKYVTITPKFAEIRVGVKSASTVATLAATKHKFYCSAVLTETV